MKQVVRLFIAGDDAVSRSAIANLERLAETCGADVETSIVDIVEDPAAARAWRILATPVLVRVLPEPRRKVIGDLADTARVMSVLGLGDMGITTGESR